MKLKEILLIVIAIATLVSAYFSFSAYRTLNAIVGPQAATSSSASASITKKYAKNLTYDKAIKSGKPVIAFFYADWCGYCKRFAPTFHKIVKQRKFKSNLAAAYINCDDQKNVPLAKEFGIKGFPTVYMIDTEGNRTEVDNSELFGPDAEKKLLDKFISFTVK